jgi:mRNA-degrading endonuclease RelE of RelBE toxin-antitoxin system
MKRPPYRIEYGPETERHFRFLTAHDAATVLDTVPRQLRHEPTVETRNRKPLEANPIAPWELRIGHLRVYFQVEDEPERVVKIRAVGIKDRNRIFIGGEEIELR